MDKMNPVYSKSSKNKLKVNLKGNVGMLPKLSSRLHIRVGLGRERCYQTRPRGFNS